MRHLTIRQNGGFVTFKAHRNDGFTLRVTLYDDNGDAIDLTGKTAYLYAKRNVNDVSNVFSITGITYAATSGVVDFRFTTTHTAAVYNYTAEIEVNGGTGIEETICVFPLTIVPDVG